MGFSEISAASLIKIDQSEKSASLQ